MGGDGLPVKEWEECRQASTDVYSCGETGTAITCLWGYRHHPTSESRMASPLLPLGSLLSRPPTQPKRRQSNASAVDSFVFPRAVRSLPRLRPFNQDFGARVGWTMVQMFQPDDTLHCFVI